MRGGVPPSVGWGTGCPRDQGIAVGSRHDRPWIAPRHREWKFGEGAGRSHPADPVGEGLGEPEVSIRAGSDPLRTGAADAITDARLERRHLSIEAHPQDPVRSSLAEGRGRDPEVPIWSDGDSNRTADVGRQVELGDGSHGREPTHLVVAAVEEPDVAVGTRDDAAETRLTAPEARRARRDGTRPRLLDNPTRPQLWRSRPRGGLPNRARASDRHQHTDRQHRPHGRSNVAVGQELRDRSSGLMTPTWPLRLSASGSTQTWSGSPARTSKSWATSASTTSSLSSIAGSRTCPATWTSTAGGSRSNGPSATSTSPSTGRTGSRPPTRIERPRWGRTAPSSTARSGSRRRSRRLSGRHQHQRSRSPCPPRWSTRPGTPCSSTAGGTR